MASMIDLRGLCGDWDDLTEPFLQLLMLVKAINEEFFLVKEVGEEIEF